MRISIFKNQKVNETEIVSPCEGKLKRLETSNDEVFALKTLGEGFFVRASDSQIYAPVSGVVTSIFPTKHAIGIQTKNGMDVMLHIGVDTVKLQKNTIESRLQVHDVVKKMQPICEIDLITFKNWGYYRMFMYLSQTVLNMISKQLEKNRIFMRGMLY